MPLYIFSNPNNPEEFVEILQSMNDIHEYIKDNIKWNREFTRPNASFDTNWIPESSQDFVEKTRNKKGTLGEIMDKSAELSEKRKEKEGIDVVKQKYYDDYAKLRDGKRHLNERKEKLKEIVKDTTIKWAAKNK
jgi:hypothetical protein